MSKPTVLLSLLLATSVACTDDSNVELETVTQEAKVATTANSMVGFWRTKTFAQGAWVDLIWVVGRHHAWHVVSAYTDEALTIPLVRWDVIRHYELGESIGTTIEMEWDDRYGRLYAYVDNPGLFAAIGIDDCVNRPGSIGDQFS